jgi:Bacterial membrane protein YfhO
VADAGSSPSSRARARLLALIGLGAVVLLLLPRVLEGWTLGQRDLRLVFLPQVDAIARCVARGAWPVWDPLLGFGQPLLANPANQVLYPPTWVGLLVRPETYLTLFVLGHLLWAGLGVSGFARDHLALSRGAAWLAGAAWIASGPLVSHVQRWPDFASAAWLPWVLLAAVRAVAEPTRARVLTFAVALALQGSAGSVEVTALTLVVAFGWTAVTSGRGTPALTSLARAWGQAGALAVALTAALWLPALDLLRHSARSELAHSPTPWVVHPARWLELLAPLPPLLPTEVPSLYLGATLGGLVLWALLAASRRRALGLLLLGAAAAVLATGSPVNGLPWLAPRLGAPSLARFAGPLTLVVSLAWALLAGLGFDALGQRFRSRFPPGAGLAACFVVSALPALALSVLATAFPESLPPSILRPPLPPSPAGAGLDVTACGAAVAMALTAAVLTSVGARRASLRSLALVGLALLAVADLVPPGERVNPLVPASLVARVPETAERLHEAGAQRIHVMEGEGAPDGRLALAGRSASRWGLAGSYAIDSLTLPTEVQVRLAELFRAQTGRPSMVRLLQAGAVSDVVTRETEMPGLVPREAVLGPLAPPVRIFQVPEPRPWSYVVGHVVPASGERALEALLDPAFDLRTTATLDAEAPPTSPADFSGTSWIATHAPDRVELSVEASAPGYLVLVDGYDPGWKATVDGQPSPVLRANYGFRAVAVPAGAHVVLMRYRPGALTAGVLVSALALAGSLLAAAGSLARSRTG